MPDNAPPPENSNPPPQAPAQNAGVAQGGNDPEVHRKLDTLTEALGNLSKALSDHLTVHGQGVNSNAQQSGAAASGGGAQAGASAEGAGQPRGESGRDSAPAPQHWWERRIGG